VRACVCVCVSFSVGFCCCCVHRMFDSFPTYNTKNSLRSTCRPCPCFCVCLAYLMALYPPSTPVSVPSGCMKCVFDCCPFFKCLSRTSTTNENTSISPYEDRKWWTRALRQPYEQRTARGVKRFEQFFRFFLCAVLSLSLSLPLSLSLSLFVSSLLNVPIYSVYGRGVSVPLRRRRSAREIMWRNSKHDVRNEVKTQARTHSVTRPVFCCALRGSNDLCFVEHRK